ncbi:hypothetical protein T484DRAFT_1980226 [Baffinella frigidus]|nr:hypothetical protein T484DRAFT_1980226 [Cryptophyta sp. CCMP2293]|mmetsp:Transcript_19796/g.47966  ORF Transcript_19796/g.47966 Transcript_19796/m.47966 type:complete len:120 (-) Transcript_19796:47-406(-)
MGYATRGGDIAKVRAAAGVIALGLLVAMCIISSTSMRQVQWVSLEGQSSGGEYEDGKALDAAISMAVATNQTDILDFPTQFNATLEGIAGNVAEANQAMMEGSVQKGVLESYNEGTVSR